MVKGKPFIKWVGGKTQLITQLEKLLPKNLQMWENATYVEPFVGGGAMLFYILQQYPNISRAIINDVNEDLILCYKTVRDNVEQLIDSLALIETEYHAISKEEKRKEFYLSIRNEYNNKRLNDIENATYFIFLNRTCFNGLYRVNKSGFFNVPFGRYKKPTICDRATLRKDSELLQKVDFMSGDFEHTLKFAQKDTFYYLDPPYRPLNATSSFCDYTAQSFCDEDQIRLKEFCDKLHQSQALFLESNSDSKNTNDAISFFDRLYNNYDIHRVFATRHINSIGTKRGVITEIVVKNYDIKSYALQPNENAIRSTVNYHTKQPIPTF